MKLISWKSAIALMGAGALCCFVSAMVAPHNIKFYSPDPGSPAVIYSQPATPSPAAPVTPVPQPTTIPPLPTPPENRRYLSCEQMRGWDSTVIVEYWRSVGSPTALDNDRDGMPCETVIGESVFTPDEWPTDVWTPPPAPPIRAPEEAPLVTSPPRADDRLPEAALPAPSPIPLPDVELSGLLVP